MRHGVRFVGRVGVVTMTGVWLAACSGQSPRGQPETSTAARPADASAPQVADITIPDSIAGWTAAGPATVYDPKSIFSYIDGHAEVYLAYGMKRCVSRRFTGPAGESDIVTDVFELASPEDAYGVFTHDRDGETVDIGRDALFRSGWLSFWKGPHFVSVVAEGESDRGRQAALDVGRAVAARLPDGGGRPAIVSQLPPKDLDPRSVRFLRHPQILNTHVFVADENVLALAPDTSVALGTYTRGAGRAFLLLAEYPDGARAAAAADAFRAGLLKGKLGDDPVAVGDRGFFALRTSGRRVDVVLSAPGAADARGLLAAVPAPAGGVR